MNGDVSLTTLARMVDRLCKRREALEVRQAQKMDEANAEIASAEAALANALNGRESGTA